MVMTSADNIERISNFKKLKSKLQNVLLKSQFCATCFDSEEVMFHCDDEICFSNWNGQCSITLEKVLSTLFNVKSNGNIQKDVKRRMNVGWMKWKQLAGTTCNRQLPIKMSSISSSYSICKKCKEEAQSAYQFVEKSNCSMEIMREYLNQLEGRLDDIEAMVSSKDDIIEYANTVIVLNEPLRLKTKETELKVKESANEDVPKYICAYCNKTFTTKSDLIQDIETHLRRTKNYSQEFKLNNLQQCERKEKRTRKFECPECESSDCKHKKYLRAYKNQRLSGNKMVKCPDCEYICGKVISLVSHADHVHFKVFKVTLCKICAKPLYSKSALKLHMRNFHTQLLSCEYCEKQFKDEKNLNKHRRQCNGKEKSYKCDQCPASFNTNMKLNNHKNKHCKNHTCDICSKVFSNKHLLAQHQTIHTKTEINFKFKCYTCKKSFSTKSERDTHNRTKHNPSGKSKCNECNIEFETFAEHRWHLQTTPHIKKSNPNGRLKHQCDYCNYSTTASESLEGHVNRFHLKIAPYPCPRCDKKFTVAKKLKSHILVHDKVKTRQCEFCGKNFSCQTAINKHMRLHTGEKPYECDVCGDKFSCTSMRSMHKMKMHSVKSIRCPLCDSLFYTVATMRCHFKKVHWKKKEPFDIRKMNGLKDEDYELFRDKRLLVLK